MKQPKRNDLRPNRAETAAIHKGVRKTAGSVKITINIDADSLSELRAMAEKSGVPYQRLLNVLLRHSLANQRMAESRLDRLEREVARLKKTRAA